MHSQHTVLSSIRTTPLVTVVISNKNGSRWLARCLQSIRDQTIVDKLELIVVDNCSTDDSVMIVRDAVAAFPRAMLIENDRDLGFTGGMNAGAAAAKATGIFFLSNDTHLEPDCLEKLIDAVTDQSADAGMPLVMDYDDVTIQSLGIQGLDLFGLPTVASAKTPNALTQTLDVFMVAGCGFWMRAQLFRELGGFDTGQFMYAEETDLSWRIWIAGGKVVRVPSARLHHRGAAGVNPAGHTRIIEARTSETKRYLANRNNLLVILKNGQHILLFLLIPQLLLLFSEACFSLLMIRRWSYVRYSYFNAVADAFRMRDHVAAWRKRIKEFRKRSDFFMLRYLRLRPSRWDEVKRLLEFGIPAIDRT